MWLAGLALLVPPTAFSQEKITADLASAPQVASEAVFTVKEDVQVAGDRIALTDVATCEGDPDVCEEAYGVFLGDTPAPGRMHLISAEKLRTMAAAEWPEAHVTLEGARFVKVNGASQEITSEMVEESLRKELSTHYFATEEKAGNFRVELVRIMARPIVKLRPGEFQIEFSELSPEIAENAVAAKRFFSARSRRLQVVFSQERFTTHETISAEFRVYEYLPVASKDFLRNDSPKASELNDAWVETNKDAGNFLTSVSAVQGRRLKRPVIAGHPFQASYLDIPVVARRGRTVRLEIKRGDMLIHGQVKLLGNGSYGEVIDAQYTNTKKKVRVKVVDAENVQLVF